ncbi:MAG: hypothetical protein KDB18_13150, partial [Salinibacterium sp.]|nr:hypothetical protein [Salinibacterium sp.]
MTVDDDSRNPVEILAEQFLRRVRGGESVTVEDYAREHPEISAEIRAVFPTMMAMEGLKQAKVHSSSGGRRVQAPVGLQRLGDFRIVREIGRGG